MKHVAVVAVYLLFLPSFTWAQQIAPNPNPLGSTMIVDTSDAVNNVDFFNHGVIDVLYDGTLTNFGSLNNRGTLGNGGTLKFKPDSSFDNTGGTLRNSGTIKSHIDDLYFGAGGTIVFQSGSDFVNHAIITIDAASVLSNDQTITNYGDLSNAGSFSNSGELINLHTLTFTTGSVSDNTGILHSHGVINNNSGGKLTNDGTLNSTKELNNSGVLNNHDTLSLRPSATLDNSGSLSNSGALTIDGGVTFPTDSFLYYETIAKTGARSLFASDLDSSHYGMGVYAGDAVLVNAGTLTNEGTLMNDGVLDTRDGTFINNGTLHGVGLIQGSFADYGQIQPGNTNGVVAIDGELSKGVLTIDGDLSKVDGSMVIELAGLFDGGGDKFLTEYDWLDVMGNAELGGTLDVSLIDGFELQGGDVFNVLRVDGTLSGQYDGLGEGGLVGNFGGQDLFITYSGGDGNDVALFTNAVPEPAAVLSWSILAALSVAIWVMKTRKRKEVSPFSSPNTACFGKATTSGR